MVDLALPSTRPATAIRWTARISGTFFMVVFLAFFVLDCMQKGRIPVRSDRIPMMLFLFLTFIGLIIAWKLEGTGGIVALGSVIGFCILGLQTDLKAGATILLTGMYALPAFLFLVYWWQARRAFSARKAGAA
jgi:hypothetical protein